VLLPAALCNFRKLSSLTVKSLRISSNKTSRQSCPEDLQQLFTAVTANVLRYLPLHGLKDLTIALPVTHDFATVLSGTATTPSRTPADTILRKIEHMDFLVCDASGPRGERYFSSSPSTAQRLFPNEAHAHKLFNIIQSAVNLRSLRVTSTHVLDMDRLNVEHLNKLQNLELNRVKILCDRLLSIARQNESTLRSFHLWWYVELKTGTWTDVLLGLCRLPKLVAFHVQSIGYAEGGDSSRYRPGLLPEIDNPRDIETYHYLDWNALGNAQRHVAAMRKINGLPEMGSNDFRNAEMESVEDVLSRGDESE
jgi:hypothetical protein